MVEFELLVVAVVAFVSAGIFLAHAIDWRRQRMRQGAQSDSARHGP
jgi:hypothetical protein